MSLGCVGLGLEEEEEVDKIGGGGEEDVDVLGGEGFECAVGDEASVVVDGFDAVVEEPALSEGAPFDPSSFRPNHPNIDLQLARLDELETARLATPTLLLELPIPLPPLAAAALAIAITIVCLSRG